MPTVLAYGARRGHIVASSRIEEDLLVRQLDDETLAEGWAKEWVALRVELTDAYGRASDPSTHDHILRLLAKGTRYFDRRSEMYVRRSGPSVHLVEDASMAELLRSVASTLAPSTLNRLECLYDEAIPSDEQQQRELKDLLFRVAKFHKDTTPELNEATKLHLLKEMPNIITALPGHRAATSGPRMGWGAINEPSGPLFSKLLDEVLDRHVFDHFDFIGPFTTRS